MGLEEPWFRLESFSGSAVRMSVRQAFTMRTRFFAPGHMKIAFWRQLDVAHI
jgi:hypothetical protein